MVNSKAWLVNIIAVFILIGSGFAYWQPSSDSTFVLRDTSVTVDMPITLFWPINSSQPTQWTELTFHSPGDTMLCEKFTSPYPRKECWKVEVYPAAPEGRISYQVMDTTETGGINYLICSWPPGRRNTQPLFPLCMVVLLRCNASATVRVDDFSGQPPKEEGQSSTNCITLENFDCKPKQDE